tara:strand:+ start:3743 stop:3886 length:144 start_codon:yes stop_codon:yes gene_type:complete
MTLTIPNKKINAILAIGAVGAGVDNKPPKKLTHDRSIRTIVLAIYIP